MDEEDRKLVKKAMKIRQSGGKDAEKSARVVVAPVMARIAMTVRASIAKASANVINDR